MQPSLRGLGDERGDLVENAVDERVVGVTAPPLARDHAGVDELLEVIADVLLRQLELGRELADADRRAGAREHVQDLQPMSVRHRAKQPLQLGRLRVAEPRAADRRTAIDGEAMHKEIFVHPAAQRKPWIRENPGFAARLGGHLSEYRMRAVRLLCPFLK